MKLRTLCAAAALLVGGNAMALKRTVDIGNGLASNGEHRVYLHDSNYSKTTGYSRHGLMTFAEAVEWADQLVFAGFSDWRLPKYLERPLLNQAPFFNVQDYYWLDGKYGGGQMLPGETDSYALPGEKLVFGAYDEEYYFSPQDTYNYAIAFRFSGLDEPVSVPPDHGVGPVLDRLPIAAIPEPSTYALMFAGLGLVGFMARRSVAPK